MGTLIIPARTQNANGKACKQSAVGVSNFSLPFPGWCVNLGKRDWIGDYESRHAAGLWIASTRVEKWNDTTVSERCKGRGMSWKETGVLAMALHAASLRRKAF